ncbi:RNA dependent RNA polymerase [Intestinimonas butyriciproducens]|uniref:RNA dependent RNA polymerase n=1 Tax=Intestinimonas butyriciproducens TaxID=1297617 RepID=UPI001899650F|nr:hypothetical protein [Intestinimonas butyriciproducens]MDB7829136.1 hypothetical protein [Intestinimonas butyriciproducens]
MISLSESQMLRFIDMLNGIENGDATAKSIKNDIKMLRKQPNSLQNRRKIKKLYEELDEIQYKPDYMCLVIDKDKDYWRARKGFKINGIKYVRLLGTNGGIKNSTIVFVSERLAPELRRRIDNGRKMDKELVPAKLEAYQALVCSASTPVPMPNGIAVVNDCVTHFKADVININDEKICDPVMELQENTDIELNESDGYGIMLPSLAKKWSDALHLDYLVSGVNTRFSWEKGMVFTFDFLDFADKVAGTRIIRDAWGNEVDLSNVELILTTSMLKLWDSYESCEEYVRNCIENGYTFGVTKTCPANLERERNLNYQFIQSYELDDEQVEELITPTINEIHDILSLDWRKSVLFLKGAGMSDESVDFIDSDFAKAIMVDRRMMNDPFVKKKIYALIKKRITDAKIGVIKVHGNYSIISGDPYSLCQSMFGLPVTGLLKAGEIYNKYWLDCGADKLACFRAPMTCHNNIRLMHVGKSEEMQYWYRYMTTCTILNSWDTATHALNGADKDGDLVLLTDNPVLVNNLRELPALMCVQRKARKIVPSEDDMIQANIDSFGDDIGKTTNRITSMFDVIAQFPKDSEEYRVLDYRIKCGQLYQQNAIDKAKGIIAKPMPREWYDRNANRSSEIEDEELRQFNLRILADKKPYFMRYIYPTMMKQYNTYISNTNKKAIREFRLTMDELLAKDEKDLSDTEREFIHYYYAKMPVGINDCVMNRICRRFEAEFDGYIARHGNDVEFDYNIMKSGQEYTQTQYNSIMRLYTAYNRRVQDYMQYAKKERLDEDECANQRMLMIQEFKCECQVVCSNKQQLCDILLDICYQKEGSKQFVWDLASEEIIENLLSHNNYEIAYPVRDDNGDVEFGGERFSFSIKRIGGEFDEHCAE